MALWVPKPLHEGGLTLRRAIGQMSEDDLVLEVQVVEKRLLQQIEMAASGADEGVAVFLTVVVHAPHRTQPCVLGHLQQVETPLGALDAIDGCRNVRMLLEILLIGDDRQPEVGRHEHESERTVVLGDEVLNRRHHAVPGTALELGVVHVGVDRARARTASASRCERPAFR